MFSRHFLTPHTSGERTSGDFGSFLLGWFGSGVFFLWFVWCFFWCFSWWLLFCPTETSSFLLVDRRLGLSLPLDGNSVKGQMLLETNSCKEVSSKRFSSLLDADLRLL